MRIHRWSEDDHGPLDEQRMRTRLEGLGYRVSRYVYPPGSRFPPHAHDVDKIDAVLEGRFRIEMQGRSVILEPGDAVEVPRGIVHSAEVVGRSAVVSLDAVRRS